MLGACSKVERKTSSFFLFLPYFLITQLHFGCIPALLYLMIGWQPLYHFSTHAEFFPSMFSSLYVPSFVFLRFRLRLCVFVISPLCYLEKAVNPLGKLVFQSFIFIFWSQQLWHLLVWKLFFFFFCTHCSVLLESAWHMKTAQRPVFDFTSLESFSPRWIMMKHGTAWGLMCILQICSPLYWVLYVEFLTAGIC